MKRVGILCALCISSVLSGMHVGKMPIYMRGSAQGVPEREFQFNVHELQQKTENAQSLAQMRSLVRDQHLLSCLVAEKTDFRHDSDFFLLDWAEEQCTRNTCQLQHLCVHKLRAFNEFTKEEQKKFCAKAIERGVLPEGLDWEAFCAHPKNCIWLIEHCLHFFLPRCSCRSLYEVYASGVRRGHIPKEYTYAQFSSDESLVRLVSEQLPHHICDHGGCNHTCPHEDVCAQQYVSACTDRGISYFLHTIKALQRAYDAPFLLRCAQRVQDFLLGLSSPTLGTENNGQSAPEGFDECYLAHIQRIVHGNWSLLHQIFSFNWCEFRATEEQEEEFFDGGAESPATQLKQLVLWEQQRARAELSDIVATAHPPQRTYYYQLPLSDKQKSHTNNVIRGGRPVMPFKYTYRAAEARSCGLLDRVTMRPCAPECTLCAHVQEQEECAQTREHTACQAVVAWMARKGCSPDLRFFSATFPETSVEDE